MKHLSIAMISSIFILSGCVSMKSYVDTSYASYDYDTLTKPAEPMPIRLETEFSTNGKPNSSANKFLAKTLTADFAENGQFVVVEDASAPLLTVALNNVANTKDAMGKGFVTGLTLGASGTTVSDGYEAKLSFDDGNSTITRDYKHGMVSTIGNEAAPEGAAEALKPAEAIDEIIEDIMARFISEMSTGSYVAGVSLDKSYLP